MDYSTESSSTERPGNSESSGTPWSQLTPQIRQNPLTTIGVAAIAGFVIGGGMRSRFGTAALLLIARMALRDVVTQTIANAMQKHDSADAASNGKY
jgi:hypothetical protein